MKFFFQKVLITCLLPMLAVSVGFAQQTVVSGRITDASGKENLPYASISVVTSVNGTLVTGTVGDEHGRFSITGLPQGEYKVNCSYVGYESKSVSLLVGALNKTYDLGKIELAESAQALSEVQVTGQRQAVSQALDKKSFDVAGNISSAGGSLLDAMSNMPGVTVDQEGKVLLRGSDKVAVLIDGKQSALTGFGNQKGLNNIPASNIERIEIINNPSAKYDASGMAGIINIIYKKERQTGFNGDVGFTFGLGALTRRKDDLPTPLGSYDMNPKYIPSLNLNYKASKFNAFLQTEVIQQKRLPNNEFTTRYYDDASIFASQVPENRTQTHYIVKGGVDWLPNERNTFTLSGVYDYESHVDTAEVGYYNLQNMDMVRYWAWNEHENTGFTNASLNYKHKFAEAGHELNAALQYTQAWEDETYDLHEVSVTRTGDDQTHIIAKEHVTQLTLDYVKPLRSGRLETGAKGHIRRLPVTYDVIRGNQTVIYPGLGDWSDWGEDMAALYANWVLEKTKFDVEAGLRAEYTSVFYDISPDNIYYPSNDSYDYFDLFPNVRLTWKINKSNRLSTFYNRRIDRPGEDILRIFPKYDDPELLKVGNPYLRPQYTQSAELAYKYIWNSGSVFISGYYKIIKDPYTRIYAVDEQTGSGNIINNVYANTGEATNAGTELIIDQRLGKSWKVSGSFNWYRNSIAAYTGTLYFPYERPFSIAESTDNTWYAKINNQLNISNNSQIQLAGVYYAPVNIPQGKRYERGGIDAGFKQSLMHGKLELTVSMSDIFNTMGIKEEVRNDGFRAVYENYYETQIVSIGAKYKF